MILVVVHFFYCAKLFSTKSFLKLFSNIFGFITKSFWKWYCIFLCLCNLFLPQNLLLLSQSARGPHFQQTFLACWLYLRAWFLYAYIHNNSCFLSSALAHHFSMIQIFILAALFGLFHFINIQLSWFSGLSEATYSIIVFSQTSYFST